MGLQRGLKKPDAHAGTDNRCRGYHDAGNLQDSHETWRDINVSLHWTKEEKVFSSQKLHGSSLYRWRDDAFCPIQGRGDNGNGWLRAIDSLTKKSSPGQGTRLPASKVTCFR